MQHKSKIKYLVLAMAALTTSSFAATVIDKQAGTKIYGNYPYFDSVGSRIVSSSLEENGVKKISVGARIEVPSYVYKHNSAEKDPLFTFVDADNDLVTAAGNPNTATFPANITPSKVTQVRWFVIEAKEGFKFADETTKTGTVIERWTPDQINVISEITDTQFVNTTAENLNSISLIVPESAVGYRIGFWALPETETGIPDAGNWVKVFDLDKLFKQTAPEGPGPGEVVDPTNPDNPDPDPECETANCGEPDPGPGGENPGGGGGPVPGENWVINIYDAKDPANATDDVLVESNDILKVDNEYYATIRIRSVSEGVGSVYRDPTPAELSTLQWEIIDLADNSTFASYTETANSDRVNNNAGTVTFGAETFKKYSFKTQATNDEALDVLKAKGPNYSEQGWGLGISIEVDETYPAN